MVHVLFMVHCTISTWIHPTIVVLMYDGTGSNVYMYHDMYRTVALQQNTYSYILVLHMSYYRYYGSTSICLLICSTSTVGSASGRLPTVVVAH